MFLYNIAKMAFFKVVFSNTIQVFPTQVAKRI